MALYYKINNSIIDQIETKDNDKNIFVDVSLLSTVTFDAVLGNEKLVDQIFINFPMNVEHVKLKNISVAKKPTLVIATGLPVEPFDNLFPAITEFLYCGFTDYYIPSATVWQDNKHFITENSFIIPLAHNNFTNPYGMVLPNDLDIKFFKNSTYVNIFLRTVMAFVAAGTDITAIRTLFNTQYSGTLTSALLRYNIYLNFVRVK
jgi:hypothetical protein